MNNIETLQKEWLALQPITPENKQRLEQKFMLEFNYNSNHIEGNTLTYGQTELLLMFDKVDGDAKMHDLEEMKAHNVGLKMMQTEATDAERPLTESFIRELHRTLLREDYNIQRQLPDGSTATYTVHAGTYKTRPNSVITATGERFEYASPEETPALMTDLVDWYNQAAASGDYTPIELASLFHYRYIRIHPFEDGNGRIARLLVNFILLRHNYPMIVVKSDNKEKYLDALNKSDINVGFTPSDGAHAELTQIQPFVEYMTSCLERAFTVCICAAKGENINEPDDFAKEIAILSKSAKMDNIDVTMIAKAKLNVYNNFHRIFADKLITELEPVKTLFNTFSVSYYMTVGVETILSVKHFSLAGNEERIWENLTETEKNILDNARSIIFFINIDNVRAGYNIDNVSIYKRAGVIFDIDSYTFNNKVYNYGVYPTVSEIDRTIAEIKNDILNKIKKATNR